jgi:hypothetical protein
MAARKSRTKTKAARPTTVAAYLASLTPEKRTVIEEARAFVRRHRPKWYAEFMNWGVINWGIPLEQFSNTYNGQPMCRSIVAKPTIWDDNVRSEPFAGFLELAMLAVVSKALTLRAAARDACRLKGDRCPNHHARMALR